jgi:hypothetical protein
VADMPGGLSLAPLQETKLKKGSINSQRHGVNFMICVKRQNVRAFSATNHYGDTLLCDIQRRRMGGAMNNLRLFLQPVSSIRDCSVVPVLAALSCHTSTCISQTGARVCSCSRVGSPEPPHIHVHQPDGGESV